jgi:hypothetical protein
MMKKTICYNLLMIIATLIQIGDRDEEDQKKRFTAYIYFEILG